MPAKKEAKTKVSPKKIFRSEKDRVVGGVCAGLGEFFDIDPTIIRILFVLITLFGGGGILLYLVLWLIIPSEKLSSAIDEEKIKKSSEEIKTQAQKLAQSAKAYAQSENHRYLLGITLLILGILFLLQNFGVFRLFNLAKLWPILLIIIAISLLAKNE